MKKLLVTLGVTLVCVGAFAQGKVSFATDSLHLVYFSTDTANLPDGARTNNLAGRGVYAPTLSLAGVTMAADLWAGTSDSSLQKVTSITAWSTAAEGRWTSTSVALPSPTFPAGIATFFQINIHDASVGSAQEAWAQMNKFGGISPIFTAAPGISAYSPLYATAAPTSSTWPVGTQAIGTVGFGAIEVYATVPEPGTFALAGLGAAVLMIFRRRK